MKVLGKPKNKWGWVRIISCAILAVVVVWMALAAVLKVFGEVSWMAWSGYQAFSLMDGFELAITFLLAVFIAGWLEEQDKKMEVERSNHRETEQLIAAQRKEIINHFHEAVLAVLPDTHSTAEVPAQVRLSISEIVRTALPQLDEKGKGELLHLLFEKGLLTGEKPVVEMDGIDFSKVYLNKAHLKGICLENVDLTNAQMDGSHLVNSRLSGANLSRAFLRHADLREAVLAGSNLSRANLEGTNLEGADLRDACLEGTFLMKANLKGCTLNSLPGSDIHSIKEDLEGSQVALDQAILIETVFPDGRKGTNEKGKEYLRKKEIEALINSL